MGVRGKPVPFKRASAGFAGLGVAGALGATRRGTRGLVRVVGLEGEPGGV
jgi:hypothetical protein